MNGPGLASPDVSYPIPRSSDLTSAISTIRRAKVFAQQVVSVCPLVDMPGIGHSPWFGIVVT